jgi:hypothetical protein
MTTDPNLNDPPDVVAQCPMGRLNARVLTGVGLVTSDAHPGLVTAVGDRPGESRQRSLVNMAVAGRPAGSPPPPGEDRGRGRQ